VKYLYIVMVALAFLGGLFLARVGALSHTRVGGDHAGCHGVCRAGPRARNNQGPE
jgi:hypothetical protein